MKSLAVIAAGLVLSPLLAACGSSSDTGATEGDLAGTITVFAASSLTGTFTELGKEFEQAHDGAKVVFEFGSSGDLATKITEAGGADVFASAAPKNMDAVVAADLVAGTPETFAGNTAEIATAPGNPKGITSLADLAEPGVKLALCVTTAPCGALATQLATDNGLTFTPTASEPDVKSTLAVVQSGEVDAGIVYVTDVKAAGDKVTGVPLTEAQAEGATTSYPIATLKDSRKSALAKAFVAFVRGKAGVAALTEAGFTTP
ncbi:molybdate ABC transporter substrate-binding protein [Nocardioides sp. Kera G14]|uniref:molybdate ABC transporter substrate-binding protein n=1 Tax=Nocardioides sp. Kera G14 TaxID=2884264 RepID=UPI001D117A9A|nr:molybdate ABC transporter substrate-binding protein [Nocardioides sp. Kera G14]UDY23335.1 molybdate ABC transporter substrate-binding protein [Nocardioides sp. Kera G14]